LPEFFFSRNHPRAYKSGLNSSTVITLPAITHASESASARARRQGTGVPGLAEFPMRCYSSAAQNGGCS
jgi:hypothetical protein